MSQSDVSPTKALSTWAGRPLRRVTTLTGAVLARRRRIRLRAPGYGCAAALACLAAYAAPGSSFECPILPGVTSIVDVGCSVVTVLDFTRSINLSRTYDLALCLEVTEHFPATRAPSFVTDLSHLATVVAFSAAIPGQVDLVTSTSSGPDTGNGCSRRSATGSSTPCVDRCGVTLEGPATSP
jgi:hypothetical protein